MFEALANLIVYQWLGLNAESHAGAALHFFVMDTAKIFAMLVIIIYVMGLLHALLSAETVRDYVRGKPRWLARSSAVTLGAVTPFCSCSSVPLFIGGAVMERFRPERWVEEYVWKIQMGQASLAAPDTSLAGRHRYAWGEVKEIAGRLH